MKRVLIHAVLAASVCLGVHAFAQCIVPVPTKPPRPREVVIQVPEDGGTTGCTFQARVTDSAKPPGTYPVGNAKCKTVVDMGAQAAAIDNGWDDGGVP